MYYFNRENRPHTLRGLLFVAAFATVATLLARLDFVKQLGLSPLIIGIIISMIYGNTLRQKLPHKWLMGILYCTKHVLRAALVFYGFRITFQEISAVGLPGLIESALMVGSTFLIGIFIGIKLLGMDKDLAMLTAAGSSICGAAAVLATESVLRSEPYKSTIAVSTVVLFGTLSMFVYPLFYKSGLLDFDPGAYGIYIGGSVHEVAQVVVSGNAVSELAADTGVIVKMTRVMLLGPMLILLSLFIVRRKKRSSATGSREKVFIPYFVFGFIGVAAFNSLKLVPAQAVDVINAIDTFMLTMAMCALGMETNFEKFRTVGARPVYLAAILFIWLIGGGYLFTRFVSTAF
ncbi:MAG: YeiH family protein [Bacteroidota bacterium]